MKKLSNTEAELKKKCCLQKRACNHFDVRTDVQEYAFSRIFCWYD